MIAELYIAPQDTDVEYAHEQLAASMLQSAMAGFGRRLLESDAPEKQFDNSRQEPFSATISLATGTLNQYS